MNTNIQRFGDKYINISCILSSFLIFYDFGYIPLFFLYLLAHAISRSVIVINFLRYRLVQPFTIILFLISRISFLISTKLKSEYIYFLKYFIINLLSYSSKSSLTLIFQSSWTCLSINISCIHLMPFPIFKILLASKNFS